MATKRIKLIYYYSKPKHKRKQIQRKHLINKDCEINYVHYNIYVILTYRF